MKRVVMLIFIYIILGQNIRHEYEEIILPDSPLNIEAEIIIPNRDIIRVILYYRTPNQENYFQLNLMSFQLDLYSGNIPISVLDGEFIEYLITAELSDGGAISLPDLNPFENLLWKIH